MNFIYQVREMIKTDLFTQSDLKTLLYSMSDAAINSGIARSLNSKDLLRLKRGTFLFSKKLRIGPVDKSSIANRLYGPSYVSFESALSHHGLIPEAVYTTTSACSQRKKKEFTNELGDFSYNYIPSKPFFMGVSYKKSESSYLIASALKALFDLIYIRKKKYCTVDELNSDLRVDLSLLKTEVSSYSSLEIERLAKSYKKKNIMDLYLLLTRTFK